MKTVTINLKDYGELVGADYSFGEATIDIPFSEYTALLLKRRKAAEKDEFEEKRTKFRQTVEEYINSGYSPRLSELNYNCLMILFKRFSAEEKQKIVKKLEEELTDNPDLKYMGQIVNARQLLEGLKENV